MHGPFLLHSSILKLLQEIINYVKEKKRSLWRFSDTDSCTISTRKAKEKKSEL